MSNQNSKSLSELCVPIVCTHCVYPFQIFSMLSIPLVVFLFWSFIIPKSYINIDSVICPFLLFFFLYDNVCIGLIIFIFVYSVYIPLVPNYLVCMVFRWGHFRLYGEDARVRNCEGESANEGEGAILLSLLRLRNFGLSPSHFRLCLFCSLLVDNI